MTREDERSAFARACAYLNYRAAAKWTAYLAAVLTSLLFIALLVLLVLFADVVAHRGLLPFPRDLTEDGRTHVAEVWGVPAWRELSEKERERRVKSADLLVDSRRDGKQKRVVEPVAEGQKPEPLTDWAEDPVNGGAPVHISYSTQPRL